MASGGPYRRCFSSPAPVLAAALRAAIAPKKRFLIFNTKQHLCSILKTTYLRYIGPPFISLVFFVFFVVIFVERVALAAVSQQWRMV